MKLIELTQGRFAKVSDEDYERVNQHKWCFIKGGYAVRRQYFGKVDSKYSYTTVQMHRFIIGAPKGTQVDHINGDKLDNTRENLRLVTHTQNQWNRRRNAGSASGYKGVHKLGDKWQVRAGFNKEKVYGGTFTDPHEAAKAYNRLAEKIYGEYAALNEVVV